MTSVIREQVFRHPPGKVWRALTEGPLIADWLMATDFAPVVGRRFTFRSEPNPHWDGIVRGEVLEAEPEVRLSYRWDAGEELRTVVTWTLERVDGGTRLRMEQSGFAAADERNRRGAEYGWERFLAALDGVVARL